MSRQLLFAALMICLFHALQTSHAANSYFWLSQNGPNSASPLPTPASPVPEIYNFKEQSTGSIYIWARPEAGQQLKNWSLNLLVSDNSILNFDSPEVYESNATNVVRWQSLYEPTGSDTEIINIAGFTQTAGGLGIGENTDESDLYYDDANDAWLLAKVNYSLKPFSAYKTANLFLQIGSLGMTNFSEGSLGVDVVFGQQGDNSLNASTQRCTSSLVPDAIIKYFDKPDADFDNDLDVDGRDFLIWQRHYLTGITNAQGNANFGGGSGQDLVVNAIDLAAWQARYNLPVSLVPTVVAVPEPYTALLGIVAMICIAWRQPSKSCIRRTSTCVPPRGKP